MQDDRRALATVEPAITPRHHRREHGPEVAALLGERVLKTRRMLRVLHPIKESLVDEPYETLAEHIAADAERALEVVEAPDSVEGFPQHERRPPVTQDVDRTRDRTGPAGERRALHDSSVSLMPRRLASMLAWCSARRR